MGRASPGSFPEEGHSRWVDNPDQGPEEEKKRLKFISEHLINSCKHCKLPMSELCRHKLYFQNSDNSPEFNLTNKRKTTELQKLIDLSSEELT